MREALLIYLVLNSFPVFAGGISSCGRWLATIQQTTRLARTHFQFDKDNFYWQFPSDHLPAAGMLMLNDSQEEFPIVTWNILNQSYMWFIENGTQGLQKSEITASADRSPRILAVLDGLMEDIHPEILALQEVDTKMLKHLRFWALQYRYQVEVVENPSRDKSGAIVDYGVVIFNPARLHFLEELRHLSHFAGPSKYIQQAGFKTHRGSTFLFANVHRLHGDNETLRDYTDTSRGNVPLVIAGDLNFDRPATDELVSRLPGFSLMEKPSGDFTHITKERKLADYDHFVYSRGVTVKNKPTFNLKVKRLFGLGKP